MAIVKYTDSDGDQIEVLTGKRFRREFEDLRDDGVIAGVTVTGPSGHMSSVYINVDTAIKIIAQLAKAV